jgi:hypothetical protein
MGLTVSQREPSWSLSAGQGIPFLGTDRDYRSSRFATPFDGATSFDRIMPIPKPSASATKAEIPGAGIARKPPENEVR